MHHLSLLLLITHLGIVCACQSCLLDMAVSGVFGRKHSNNANKKDKTYSHSMTFHSSTLPVVSSTSVSSALSNAARSVPFSLRGVHSPELTFLAVRKLVHATYTNRVRCQNIANVRVDIPVSVSIQSKWAGGLFISESKESLDDGNDADTTDSNNKSEDGVKEEIDVMSGSMIMAIGFYKHWISPLLPPACRFLPTCSQYGVQAIEEFGPQKGLILTAWRLARCTPLGGKGYDPPKWPPVAYNYGSY